MCEICGVPYNIPCECSKPYCNPCRGEECINERAECVVYHLDDDVPNKLTCLGVPNKSSLQDFLESLNDRVCHILSLQQPLVVHDTYSVDLTATGIVNHTLKADVRISTDADNAVEIKYDGLYNPAEDGRIKVDANDTLDYLADQVDGDSDGIMNVSVYDDKYVLFVQPSIDISNLLSEIRIHHLEKFCQLVSGCAPQYCNPPFGLVATLS